MLRRLTDPLGKCLTQDDELALGPDSLYYDLTGGIQVPVQAVFDKTIGVCSLCLYYRCCRCVACLITYHRLFIAPVRSLRYRMAMLFSSCRYLIVPM